MQKRTAPAVYSATVTKGVAQLRPFEKDCDFAYHSGLPNYQTWRNAEQSCIIIPEQVSEMSYSGGKGERSIGAVLGIIASVITIGFCVVWLAASYKGVSETELGSRLIDPIVPRERRTNQPPSPKGVAPRPKARIESSVRYEQARTRYLNPETWISQRVIVRLREYAGVRVRLDRYIVTLFESSGRVWIRREFELPSAIIVEAKSAVEGSFFLDKVILDLWNNNNMEPDASRAKVETMVITLIGEDENGHKITVEAEGNN